MKKLSNLAVYSFYISYIIGGLFFSYLFIGYFVLMESSLGGNSSLFANLFPFVVVWTIFLLAILLVWAKLSVENFRYELTKDSFKKEFGVVVKRYVAIPYSKIQNVDIYRGVVDRLLGLSTLIIQTAGISGQIRSEGSVPGLNKEDALALREELLKRVG